MATLKKQRDPVALPEEWEREQLVSMAEEGWLCPACHSHHRTLAGWPPRYTCQRCGCRLRP